MIVSISGLCDEETSRSDTRPMAILLKYLPIPVSLLFPLTQCTIADVFVDVLIHAFPVTLTFDKMIGSIDYLVSQFVMAFNEYCKMLGLGDD